MGLLLIIAIGWPPMSIKVEMAEVNTVIDENGKERFTQVILWRWIKLGPDGSDHYVTDWEIVENWELDRDGNRYELRWRSKKGDYRRVSCRTFRMRQPTTIDYEVRDRKRLPTNQRKSYFDE